MKMKMKKREDERENEGENEGENGETEIKRYERKDDFVEKCLRTPKSAR